VIAAADVTEHPRLSKEVRLGLPEASSKRRWLWPVVGVSAAVVVSAAIAGIVVGARGTDYRDNGRALCAGQSGCSVITLSVSIK
jgi:hypothetical protein